MADLRIGNRSFAGLDAVEEVLLFALAGESDAVDLRAWIAAAYAKAYPLTRKELAPLLEGKRY